MFNKTNKIDFKINFVQKKRRCSINYSKLLKAREEIGWQSSHNLEKMCKDSWQAIQMTVNELKDLPLMLLDKRRFLIQSKLKKSKFIKKRVDIKLIIDQDTEKH